MRVSNPVPASPDLANVASDAPRWNSATRILFAWFVVYFVLVLGPQILFSQGRPSWWPVLMDWVGRKWIIVSLLGLAERSARYDGPATSLASVLGVLATAGFSLVVALAWFVVNRRTPSYPRLHACVHTVARFALAAVMVRYGLTKVWPGQFGVGVDPATLARQVGQLHPQELLWAFMGASRSYTVFAGVVETVGGLLLFFRRTDTLGALVSAGALTNVLMLNLAYDVVVKLYSAQLLVLALFILAPDAKRLGDVLVLNRPTRPRVIPPAFPRVRLDRLARIVGVLVAIWLVYANYQFATTYARTRVAARATPLHGIWEIEAGANGGGWPVGGEPWRYLVFPHQDVAGATVIFTSNRAERYQSKIDRPARTLELSSLQAQVAGTRVPPLAFTFSRPDDRQLVLQRTAESGETMVLRFHRVAQSSFPLTSHTYRWFW